MTDRLSFRNGVQFAWDSTSLTTFKECPRKYYYSIVQGYATREQSVHRTFGIYLHEAYEHYHRLRAPYLTNDAAPHGHEEAVRRVVKEMMVKTAPWKSDDKIKNRRNLIRTIIWYLEEFKDDPAKTVILSNGRPAVELSFRFEIPDAPDFLYCGHMDRIAEFGGDRFVFDYKSTKRALYTEYFAQFTPHNQMTGYTLGGKITFKEPVAGVIIDAAQVGVTFSRFSRGSAPRDDETLAEWLSQTAYWVKLAATYASENFWPLNESSCDKYFGCPFRPVCSKSPRQRDIWLKADYVHRLWDPLQIRGDI
jgi:hypothetical protein